MAALPPQDFNKYYDGFTDDALLDLAASGDELIPEAEAAFVAELTKRGLLEQATALRQLAVEAKLPPPVQEGPQAGDPSAPELEDEEELAGDGVLEYRDLVVVDRFRDPAPAQLAQGALKSAGIDAVLWDEITIRTDWLWSNLIGGIRLMVEPQDAEAAVEILKSPTPESIDLGEGEKYVHVICPRCGSTETTFEDIDKRWAGIGMWVNLPLLVPRNEWYCSACGNHWKQPYE